MRSIERQLQLSSLPGLTRQSIAFQKMDARVKPAHDVSSEFCARENKEQAGRKQ
jgi:hypothetical protein